MPRVFVCYRRNDNPEAAGRIRDHLAAHFGKENVFMDVDGILPGQDFAEVISGRIKSCDAMVAVISKDWQQQRLDEPDDFVRIEIEAALDLNLFVVPVMVGHNSLPKRRDLPPSVSRLLKYSALEIRHVSFEHDMAKLIDSIDRFSRDKEIARQKADARHAEAVPDHERAATSWQSVLNLSPDDAEAVEGLNRVTLSIESLRRLEQLKQTARNKLQSQEYSAAISTCEEALALRPEDTDLLHMLSEASALRRKEEEALRVWRQSTQTQASPEKAPSPPAAKPWPSAIGPVVSTPRYSARTSTSAGGGGILVLVVILLLNTTTRTWILKKATAVGQYVGVLTPEPSSPAAPAITSPRIRTLEEIYRDIKERSPSAGSDPLLGTNPNNGILAPKGNDPLSGIGTTGTKLGDSNSKYRLNTGAGLNLSSLKSIVRFDASLNGEVVFDTFTSLMWMSKDFVNIEGRFASSWSESLAWRDKINGRSYGGYKDWRMPTVAEYQSVYKSPDRAYFPVQSSVAEEFWAIETSTGGIYPMIDTKDGSEDFSLGARSGKSVRLVRGTRTTP